jgi:hypothetical protein
MNRVSKFAAAAAVAALMAASSPASATILTATFTGFIASGHDQTGLFGNAGQNLAGLAYVTQYTFDTTAGLYDNSYANGEAIEGGAFYGASSPVTATMTVNGVTLSQTGPYKSYVFRETDVPAISYLAGTLIDTPSAFADEDISNYAFVDLAALSSTLATTATLIQGDFSFNSFDRTTNTETFDTFGQFSSQGTITISDGSTPGVPEPATWGLMIMGFGGAGAALRRRRMAGATA